MKIYLYPTSYAEVLANTDDDGYVAWVVDKPYAEDIPDVGQGIHEHRLAIAEQFFCMFPTFLSETPICTSKAFIKRLDPTFQPHPESYEHVQVSANACALFGLPGLNPKAELDSLRAVIQVMRDGMTYFYEQNPDNYERVGYDVFNSGRPLVLEAIEVVMGFKEGPVFDYMKGIEAKLRAMIAADPALHEWMRYQRRLLNAIGPHSWFRFNDEQLFEKYDTPLDHRYARQKEAEKNEDPVAKRLRKQSEARKHGGARRAVRLKF